MIVHLPVHVVAGHNVVLNGIDAALLDDQLPVRDPQHTQNPLQIKFTVRCTRKVRIPAQIVHSVRVQLARHQLRKQRIGRLMTDHIRHLVRQSFGRRFQNPADFRILFNDPACPHLM